MDFNSIHGGSYDSEPEYPLLRSKHKEDKKNKEFAQMESEFHEAIELSLKKIDEIAPSTRLRQQKGNATISDISGTISGTSGDRLAKDIQKINDLVRQALNCEKAYVEVTPKEDRAYDIVIHPGIKGPVNDCYIDCHLIGIMLNPIVRLRRNKELDKTVRSTIRVTRENAPEEKDHYQIKIGSLPKELFVGKQPYSLNNAISRFIRGQKKGDFEEILGEQDPEKISLGKKCHEDLLEKRPDIMKKYIDWKPKVEGYQPGIVLTSMSKKTGELHKTYVKQFSELEAVDSSVLQIAKKCGVRAPKVKVVTTKDSCYLFSTGIEKPKAGKRYIYKNLTEYLEQQSSYVDFDALTLSLERNRDGSFAAVHPIDRVSIARILLSAVIFGLDDLHQNNIGLIFSEKEGIKKLKLALLDFGLGHDNRDEITDALLPDNRKIEELETAHTFSDFVKHYVLQFSHKDHRESLSNLVKNVSDEDYLEAFNKFEKKFPETLFQAQVPFKDLVHHLQSIRSCPTETTEMFRTVEERWPHNFAVVQQQVKKFKNLREKNLTA